MVWAEIYLHTRWHLSSRLATRDMGQKLGGVGVPFFWGAPSWIPIKYKVAWAEAYLHPKWHLSPSSRLPKTDIDVAHRCPPLLGEGRLGPHLTQSRLG